ncbi:glutamine-hydrolyzing carbamoyl-phosphate synthase small subunit [Dongshaea marina]|uniref:glutamine-hydrolyzing carbamoyl-phosphate synthase small subunit n=1 Tax=Dongshaea marina TaxID=2047966 RepID=UPI000D3E75EB|nr:glutamine-hydrolyzing carbamoyl-phosphate synthase small subunit [Dongshaea marina]
MDINALLVLEDGTQFEGVSIGAEGYSVGEVVFNTSPTGYQEILTDPSYSHQLVTLTYPHIGNTGTTPEDTESSQIHAAGLIIRDYPLVTSNFRNQQTLSDYLTANGIVALSEIDTRKLTRLLRDKGAQRACLMAGSAVDPELGLKRAREFSGLKGMDLAREVTTEQSYLWREGSWLLGEGHPTLDEAELPYHVVVYDFGVKHNILRMLTDRGCRLSVVPATTSAADVLAMAPDGVFLSNGPGDPEPCEYAIQAIGEFLDRGTPLFGICLGHQLLALASGAKTVKMKFGHHGANHPVKDLASGRVWVTSQNHGFAVDESSLPENLRSTHVSLFDGTLQGIERTDKPAFSFQGHPEASPGPHDCAALFDHFISLMKKFSV